MSESQSKIEDRSDLHIWMVQWIMESLCMNLDMVFPIDWLVVLVNTSCMFHAEQSGEGISDYFTLVATVEEGDTGADSRGIGNYADGQNINGTGIRSFPYSTDFCKSIGIR